MDVRSEELGQTSSEFGQRHWRALPVVADVTQPAQVDSAVARIEEELGPIDVLVNNAGTFSTIGPVWEADPDRWFRDVRVNLYGAFLCCRAVAKRMVPRGRGYIINVASSGGVGDAHPYSTSYAASKTAQVRLTEGLAKELEPHGVKAFVIGPPAILTEMTRFIMDDPGGRAWRPGFGRIFDEGRDYPPELVADFILKLLSGRADALTGRFFLVTADFERIVAQADRILAEDLLTLRMRDLP